MFESVKLSTALGVFNDGERKISAGASSCNPFGLVSIRAARRGLDSSRPRAHLLADELHSSRSRRSPTCLYRDGTLRPVCQLEPWRGLDPGLSKHSMSDDVFDARSPRQVAGRNHAVGPLLDMLRHKSKLHFESRECAWSVREFQAPLEEEDQQVQCYKKVINKRRCRTRSVVADGEHSFGCSSLSCLIWRTCSSGRSADSQQTCGIYVA